MGGGRLQSESLASVVMPIRDIANNPSAMARTIRQQWQAMSDIGQATSGNGKQCRHGKQLPAVGIRDIDQGFLEHKACHDPVELLALKGSRERSQVHTCG
jgi:hypothetical protein